MQTRWDLTLLYDSLQDERIERDIKKTERGYKKFNKDLINKSDWLQQPDALLLALQKYESLGTLPGHKALYYAHYITELDGSRADAEALLMQLQDRLTKAGNLLIFFENRLSKIPKERQQKFLKDKKLSKYKYALSRLFIEGRHTLDEQEEKILSLTAPPRSSMWVSGVDKLINKQTVQLGNVKMPINEALSKTAHMQDTKKRRAWHNETLKVLKSISDFPESEINAVFTNKKTMDELRGFKEPYDSTIISYENDKKSVLALVDTVTSNYKLAHEFMHIKKSMLKLDKMYYADRSAPAGKLNKRISFAKAAKIVEDSFYEVGETYGDIFGKLLGAGQVDVYPKVGKTGGAYCSGSVNMPTFLLLNHTNDLNSLYTLAHEMGHAIHTELSKRQPITYQGYSTAVAETASTFFERVVFDKIFTSLSMQEQIVALHNKIQDDIATVFRQVAFFNFELELHNAVREQGWVPKEQMAKMLQKHLQAYLGKAVEVSELDGYSFVYIGHFRRPFYVYSYAFGQLISGALFAKYKKDNSYIKQIDKFLSAGGSASPERIFRDMGLNIKSGDFWQEGIQEIRNDIKTLKKLLKAK